MAQAIVTKYFGATSSRGARIQVKGWWATKYYSYDYAADDAHEATFTAWLKEANSALWADDSKHLHFKKVGKGCNPCGNGYTFIIQ